MRANSRRCRGVEKHGKGHPGGGGFRVWTEEGFSIPTALAQAADQTKGTFRGQSVSAAGIFSLSFWVCTGEVDDICVKKTEPGDG